jgi:hypothetical protein
MYAMSQSPYALHSPTLLAELGLNVRVLCEGEGISRRGTSDNAPFSGDVIRKMLGGMTLQELVDWYNRVVGDAYLAQVNYSPNLHILDCTELEVNLDNENYEGSGISRREKKKPDGSIEEEVKRGYKLGSLRSLLDDGGMITAIAFGAMNVHDLTLCKDILMTTSHLKPGDMVIEDCGFLDGKTISSLKKKRKVDVILPLRSDMKAYADSLITAYDPFSDPWEQHPTRERQQIKKVDRVDWMWDECSVPMDGCVVRELEKGKDGSGGKDDYEHWVFVTTRVALTGKRMIQTYQLRLLVVGDPTPQAVEAWSVGYRQVHFHQPGSDSVSCDMCSSVLQSV